MNFRPSTHRQKHWGTQILSGLWLPGSVCTFGSPAITEWYNPTIKSFILVIPLVILSNSGEFQTDTIFTDKNTGGPRFYQELWYYLGPLLLQNGIIQPSNPLFCRYLWSLWVTLVNFRQITLSRTKILEGPDYIRSSDRIWVPQNFCLPFVMWFDVIWHNYFFWKMFKFFDTVRVFAALKLSKSFR